MFDKLNGYWFVLCSSRNKLQLVVSVSDLSSEGLISYQDYNTETAPHTLHCRQIRRVECTSEFRVFHDFLLQVRNQRQWLISGEWFGSTNLPP